MPGGVGSPDAQTLGAIEAALRKFNIQLWTFYAFAVIITCLRTYSRLKAVGLKNFRPDDFIVWIAILLYTVQTTLAYFAVNYGQGLANNAMTDEQRASLSPTSQEWKLRLFGSKVQVVGWTSYVMLIFTLKLAILFFYLRLMEGLSYKHRVRIWYGFGILIATWIASLLAIYVPCRPLNHYWQIHPDPGQLCHGADSVSIVWSTFASSVVTDIILIIIPQPILWDTTLPLAKKIGASFILGAGIFVLLCSALKTIFVTIDPVNGAQLSGEWGTREAFASVVTTNLPMLFPLLRSWLGPVFGSFLKSTRTNSDRPSRLRTIGGGVKQPGSGSTPRRTKNRSDKSGGSTSLSFCGSEESIVGNVKMQDLKVECGTNDKVSDMEDRKGIIVSSEFHIHDDMVSNNGDHTQKTTVPGSWTNLGDNSPRRA